MNRRKIAFIRVWDGLVSSDSVLGMLKMTFPDHQIVEITIFPDVVKKKNFINLYHCLREYGIEILRGKKNIYSSIVRTPHYFYKVKNAMSDLLQ